MKSVYNNPAYADVQKDMHKRLNELRIKYGDSDAIDQHYLKEYLKAVKKE